MMSASFTKKILRCTSASALAAGTLVSLASAAGGSFNAPADVKAITTIEHDLATFSSMHNLIQYYAPDAYVLDAFAPGTFRGRQEIYAGFEKQFQAVKSFHGEMPDLNIMTNGRFACAAMQLRFTMTKPDGTQASIALRQLDAFKKIDGRWLIVQQHISFPMDQKTGMGLMNADLPVRGPLQWSSRPLPGPATDPAQAKREIRDWLVVGGVSPDLDTLMNYYGPGDDVLVYNLAFPPGEFRGRQEIREGFAQVMNMTDPHMKLLDFVVDSDGSFGIQIDAQELTITPKGGASTTFVMRQSDCLRRVDGKWYAVMEALSEPIDALTGKAVLNPPPPAETP